MALCGYMHFHRKRLLILSAVASTLGPSRCGKQRLSTRRESGNCQNMVTAYAAVAWSP